MLDDLKVLKITRFQNGTALAGVNFSLGPVVVRGAKIFAKDGRRWLSMPGRIDQNGEWGDLVYFLDKNSRALAESAILREFDAYEAASAQTAEAQ